MFLRRVTIIPLNKITPNPLKPNQLNRAATIAQSMGGNASCAIELVSGGPQQVAPIEVSVWMDRYKLVMGWPYTNFNFADVSRRFSEAPFAVNALFSSVFHLDSSLVLSLNYI